MLNLQLAKFANEKAGQIYTVGGNIILPRRKRNNYASLTKHVFFCIALYKI